MAKYNILICFEDKHLVQFIAVFETAVFRPIHIPHFTNNNYRELLHLFCPEWWGGRSTAWGGAC